MGVSGIGSTDTARQYLVDLYGESDQVRTPLKRTDTPELELESQVARSWIDAFNDQADEIGYHLINSLTVGIGGWLIDKFGFDNRVDKTSYVFQTGETIDTGISALSMGGLYKGAFKNVGKLWGGISDISLSVKRTGNDLLEWTRGIILSRRLPTKSAARVSLEGGQAVAANRFFRGAGKKGTDFQVASLSDGTTRLSFFDPARNEGYGKVYVQIIDQTGKVLREFKDTLGPTGLLERKWLKGGPK